MHLDYESDTKENKIMLTAKRRSRKRYDSEKQTKKRMKHKKEYLCVCQCDSFMASSSLHRYYSIQDGYWEDFISCKSSLDFGAFSI